MVLEEFQQHLFELKAGKWAELERLVQRYESTLGNERVEQIRSEVAARRNAQSHFRVSSVSTHSTPSNVRSQITAPNLNPDSVLVGQNLSTSDTKFAEAKPIGFGVVASVKRSVAHQSNLEKEASTPPPPPTPQKQLKDADMFAMYDNLPLPPSSSKRPSSKLSTSEMQQRKARQEQKDDLERGRRRSPEEPGYPRQPHWQVETDADAAENCSNLEEQQGRLFVIDDNNFRHRRRAHEDGSYYLCRCGYGGISKQHLEDHLWLELFDNVFQCPEPYCISSFGNGNGGFDAFKVHRQACHGAKFTGQEGGCFMCGSLFRTKEEQEEHENTSCPNKGKLEAAMEPEPVPNVSAPVPNIRNSTTYAERKMQSQTRAALSSHHRVPTSNEGLPFKCKCGYEGQIAEHLLTHLKTSIYPNILRCAVPSCGATYPFFRDLKNHCYRLHQMDILSGAGCLMCGMAFETWTAMQKHTSTVCPLRGTLKAAMELEEGQKEGLEIVKVVPSSSSYSRKRVSRWESRVEEEELEEGEII